MESAIQYFLINICYILGIGDVFIGKHKIQSQTDQWFKSRTNRIFKGNFLLFPRLIIKMENKRLACRAAEETNCQCQQYAVNFQTDEMRQLTDN